MRRLELDVGAVHERQLAPDAQPADLGLEVRPDFHARAARDLHFRAGRQRRREVLPGHQGRRRALVHGRRAGVEPPLAVPAARLGVA